MVSDNKNNVLFVICKSEQRFFCNFCVSAMDKKILADRFIDEDDGFTILKEARSIT